MSRRPPLYAARHGRSRVTRRARRSVEVRREEILSATVAAARPARPRRGPGGRRGRGARREPGAGLLPLRDQGRPGRRGLRPRGRAGPAPAGEAAVEGDEPVERLRRVLRLYGPTGRGTGWRIWIDAWALAQREPQHPQGRSAARPPAGRTSCAAWSTTASRAARSPARTRRPRWRGVSALLDGLSVAASSTGASRRRAAAQLGGRRGSPARSSGSTSRTLAADDAHHLRTLRHRRWG